MADDNKYPDLLPNTLGLLKSIERLPQMECDDKRGRKKMRIHWGEDYMSWPLERRLAFAEDLASSMNNAADVLQQERNKLVELANRQEENLKAWAIKYEDQGRLLTERVTAANTEKQQRLQEMQDLKAELRQLKKTLAALQAG